MQPRIYLSSIALMFILGTAALTESALAQSPNGAVRAMSAIPPVATGLRTSRIGSFVP
jgi:hypothetical protein